MIGCPDFIGVPGSVDVSLAMRGGYADRNIFQRSAEPAHGMPFEMGKNENGIIILEMIAHIIYRKLFSTRYRKFRFSFLIHDIHLKETGPAMGRHSLPMLLRCIAFSFIGCVAFHNGSLYMMDDRLHEFRADKILVAHFTGMNLNSHFPGKTEAQGFIHLYHGFRGDIFCKINL